MIPWKHDLFKVAYEVELRGLKFVCRKACGKWSATCSFSAGRADEFYEAGGFLGLWDELEEAQDACRRHWRRAARGEYRRGRAMKEMSAGWQQGER